MKNEGGRLIVNRYTLTIISLLLLLLVACAGSPLEETPANGIGRAPDPAPTPTLLRQERPPTPFITPWIENDGDDQWTAVPPTPAISPTPSPSLTPTSTPTPSPSPTPTPLPAERLAIGQRHLHNENFAAAAEQFQSLVEMGGALDSQRRRPALYGLALAHLGDADYSAAIDLLNQYLAQPADDAEAAAYFHLGRAYQAQGEYRAAIGAYQSYLEAYPEMGAYAQRRIAACYLALEETEEAIAALEAAAALPSHRVNQVEIRLQLAQYFLDNQEYAAAVAQYDAILDAAQTENTRGQATYLAGQAEIMAGNEEAGYQRFLEGVSQYPRSAHTFQGLVELVNAEVPVDEFQRGLVNYHARNYTPAVAALQRYLEANPDQYRPDAHLYLAWSYEGLGNRTAALEQLAAYGQTAPENRDRLAEALLEEAKLRARAGQRAEAIETYLAVVENYPAYEEAPFAAWWAAVLTEWEGDALAAAELYRALAENYPAYANAPRALFRAGWLAYREGEEALALERWRQTLENFSGHEYGAAALIWLLKSLPEEEAEPYHSLAAAFSGISYYELRLQHLIAGVDVFQPAPALDLTFDEAAERRQAEAWLRDRFNLEPEVSVGGLAPALANDPRFILGRQLWELGLYNEAKRELEEMRIAYAGNALYSYQLARAFRDLGLYRSSILAAGAVMQSAGVTPLEAPPYLARLAYPVYYADLILPLAEEYDYDPLLQFALVRQESLFESFAVSHAAAQGLSQVIPDTGVYIAQRLGWPDYRNELLYRPHVGLAFGAYYLQQQLNSFDGSVYAALSAYNAGPGNAARWHNAAPDDPDHYIEIVNFPETRLYIERIYSGHVIYKALYGIQENN